MIQKCTREQEILNTRACQQWPQSVINLDTRSVWETICEARVSRSWPELGIWVLTTQEYPPTPHPENWNLARSWHFEFWLPKNPTLPQKESCSWSVWRLIDVSPTIFDRGLRNVLRLQLPGSTSIGRSKGALGTHHPLVQITSFPFSLKNKTTFQVRLCLLLCDKIFFITVLRQISETDKTDFVLLHKRMPNVKFMRSSIGLSPREFPLSTYSKWILKRVLYVLKEMSLPKICRLFSPKF